VILNSVLEGIDSKDERIETRGFRGIKDLLNNNEGMTNGFV